MVAGAAEGVQDGSVVGCTSLFSNRVKIGPRSILYLRNTNQRFTDVCLGKEVDGID